MSRTQKRLPGCQAAKPSDGSYPQKLWNKLGITKGQGVEGALLLAGHWVARWVSKANRANPDPGTPGRKEGWDRAPTGTGSISIGIASRSTPLDHCDQAREFSERT